MSSDDIKKQEFILAALPTEWLTYAEDLADAAEALWSHGDEGLRVSAEGQRKALAASSREAAHARAYMLLAGLALENVLKALLIARDSSLVDHGVLDPSIKTHSLVDLATKLSLPLSQDEAGVLAVCQDAVPYWGRYPIPLHYNQLAPAVAGSEEFRETFRSLHHRLCNEVHQLIRDGWNSGAGPRTVKARNVRYGDVIDPSESLFD